MSYGNFTSATRCFFLATSGRILTVFCLILLIYLAMSSANWMHWNVVGHSSAVQRNVGKGMIRTQFLQKDERIRSLSNRSHRLE